MMSPIGRFLVDFSPRAPAPPPPIPDENGFDDLLVADEDPALPAMPEPWAEVEAPAETAEPAVDPEAAMAELRASHAAELAAARQLWADEQGAVLAGMITEAFADLEQRLADGVSRILEPFLTTAVRLKAIAELRDTIATLVANGDRPIVVSGPADLVYALRASAGERPMVSFKPDEKPEVTIAMGDTRVRSQLRTWARRLEKAMGAPA